MAHLDPMLAWDGDQDDSMGYDGQDASMQPGSAVLPTSPGSRQTLSLLDSLDEALAGLESEDASEKAIGARQLTQLVEDLHGQDAVAVGGYVRESGALELLLELVRSHACDLQPRDGASRAHALRHLIARAHLIGTQASLTFSCSYVQVTDPAPEVHQKLLMVIGNLVSDAVDPQVSNCVELSCRSCRRANLC